MVFNMTSTLKSHTLFSVYLLGFLYAFRTALPTYINSSFLNVYISERVVGLIYIFASIFTVLCFFYLPFVLKRFGNFKTALTLIIAELIALLGLVFINNSLWLIIVFVVNLAIIPLVYFSMDIFLEGFSRNSQTGTVRGIYLTSVNLAWAFSPLISGLLLADNDYWKIYLASFIFLLPVLLILVINLRQFKDSNYEVVPVWRTIKSITHDKNISAIFGANFLLFFFYSWMTIYTPLYLNKFLGFSWGQIGTIFFIMLLPFVLVQLPLGRIADKKFGEKEILSLGFFVIAVSTCLITFIDSRQMWLWAAILFITRVGASMIEIMCDTYFFKKVGALNAGVISFYRMVGPLAYVLGPLVAMALIVIFKIDLSYLFLILGLIMLIGLVFSLRLKDTK